MTFDDIVAEPDIEPVTELVVDELTVGINVAIEVLVPELEEDGKELNDALAVMVLIADLVGVVVAEITIIC